MKIKNIFKFFYTFFLGSAPLLALAQITINIPNPAGANNNLMAILRALLNNVIMPIAAVMVVMYIIYAGFTFVQANGNPKKIQEAQQRLLWGLIGAGILLGAAAISSAVCNTLRNILTSTTLCG